MDPMFTFAEGLAAGMTRRQLRACTRLANGLLLRDGLEVTPRVLALATLRGLPEDSYVSHHTAARLMGLSVPGSAVEHATVASAAARRRGADRLVHVRPVGSVAETGGVRLSAPHQLFDELAGVLGLIDAVSLGDSMLRRAVGSEAGFRAAASSAPARRAAGLVRRGVDSPLETRARLLFVLGGLPEPEIDHVVRNEWGEPVRQHDMRYAASRTMIECDGRHHADVRRQWKRDIRQRETAENEGYRVVVLTAGDLYARAGETLARVHQILAERGERDLPPSPGRGWRRHFEF